MLPFGAMALFADGQRRLFLMHLEIVRNFHQFALIPCFTWVVAGGVLDEEKQSVIEIERDGRVGIDLKFGSITFKEETQGTFAIALIDVLVGDGGAPGTRVQMEVKVAADPGTESILAVTELCRAHIAATLRAAADTFDGTTARGLLFHGGPSGLS